MVSKKEFGLLLALATAAIIVGAILFVRFDWQLRAPLESELLVERLEVEPEAFFELNNSTLARIPSQAREVFFRAFAEGRGSAVLPAEVVSASNGVLKAADVEANGLVLCRRVLMPGWTMGNERECV